jgi:hypothetical protein
MAVTALLQGALTLLAFVPAHESPNAGAITQTSRKASCTYNGKAYSEGASTWIGHCGAVCTSYLYTCRRGRWVRGPTP